MPERVVWGGSIAALVAADALAERGEDVRLLLPARGVGGGFAAIRRDGRVLELGVRALELGYEGVGEPPPLTDYVPGIGAHRPYARLVDAWVQDLLGERIVPLPRPLMLLDGRLVDDLYFTTDALALREALGEEERAAIHLEARAARDAVGEAGVLAPERVGELAAMTTSEASRANHGDRFHERFVAPFADKVVPGGADAVLATLRRKVWVPLFWPATLAQACNGGDVSFRPDRPLHTVAPDGCAGLVDALRTRLEGRGVRIETPGALEGAFADPAGGVELTFEGGASVRARRPVLGGAAPELFAAAGGSYRPAQARSVICWIELAPEHVRQVPSVLSIVDPEIPALRVSAGGSGLPGRQLLTVELRHDLPQEEIGEAALRSLAATGLLTDDAEPEVVMAAAAPTFPLPTAENVAAFADARAAFDSRGLDAVLVGGAADFAADALGEQIIQGLKAAEELSA